MQKQINSNSTPININSTKTISSLNEQEKEFNISKSTKNEEKNKKKNVCYICNKSFSTLGNMRNHIKTIHEKNRPFKCKYPGCNKEYSIESRYEVHLRTHKGEKPFICKICKKAFNEKGNLKTHLRFHSEKRPFKCQYCQKSYKINGHLKDHIDIQHNLIKKYACKFCSKKFGRISTLNAHIRTHTGEKNFKCKIEGCNKYFAEKGNMEIHYQRHLKKLNRLGEINGNIKKKKYGEKNIEEDYEKKIKDAIDCLNNTNIRKDISNSNLIKLNNKKSLTSFIFNKDDNNVKFPQELKNNNFVNKSNLYSNLNNVNIIMHSNDITNNNSRIINENNCTNNLNNVLRNYKNLNNYSNKEQNFIIGNETNNNIIGCLDLYPLIQEFYQIDPLAKREIKKDHLFNKETNDMNIDFYNCITRPSSNATLCMKKKQPEIFAKEEDIFSVEESLSNDNNMKNINDNSYLNENISMQNYDFLDNQQGCLNENKNNNFIHNFNDVNECNNLMKTPESIKFIDKTLMFN